MATQLTDPGKLIRAKLPGECEECRGSIVPGQPIYFSRVHGSRHQGCYTPEPPPAADRERAPRDVASPAAASDASRAPARDLFAARDDSPVAVGWPDAGDAHVADRARATAFGAAGDRDAARRELANVIRLLIEALQRIERVLA